MWVLEFEFGFDFKVNEKKFERIRWVISSNETNQTHHKRNLTEANSYDRFAEEKRIAVMTNLEFF